MLFIVLKNKDAMVTRVVSNVLFCILLGLFSVSKLNAQCEGFMVDITSDPPPPFNLCPGETILLMSIVTGGTPPYSYLWADGSTGSTTVVTPPYNGSFPLDVTDAIGCVASNSIHIKATVWAVDIIYVGLSVCVGDSMELFAFPDFPGGTTFLWSTGETSNSIFITTSDTYSLTVTAPGGECSSSITEFIEMSFFPQPEPTISGPAFLCAGQNATLTALGGPNDTFEWSTGETTSSIIISTPDNYWVTVTSEYGCTGIDSIEILLGATEPDISAPLVLCPGQNGTIEITNAPSYIDFIWSTGETTSTINISAPGTYSVTVTASGGCTSMGSVTVNGGNSNIIVDGNISPVTSCLTPNGSVDITVSPPGTYSYIWSNGSSTEDINNLTSGNYTITVTDSGGCSSSATYFVDSNLVLPTTTSNITATSCDLNNGSIDLNVTPPGTYTFIWSNGSTSEDLSNIQAGMYSVTVTSSSNGCSAIASASVPNINLTLTITGNTTPLTSCTTPNGAVDISTSPTGTYTYNWSNGATTEDIANLTFGNYTVTVSAGGSCTATAAFIVDNNTNPPVPMATTTAATCGQSNGAIDLTVTPAGTYTYLWSNGSSTEDLMAIPGGSYTVTVTSADGCTNTTNIVVEDNMIPLALSGTIVSNTSCTTPNGGIDISINPPGTYSFQWSNGATTEDLVNIPAGSYSITATLGLTCQASESFVVDDNLIVILISGNTTPNTSCSQPNGAIDLIISTPGVFTFFWSNGQTTEDLQQLTGGTYSVTVTGDGGCTNTTSFDIINTNSNFNFNEVVVPNTSCNSPNGTIDLTVSPAGLYLFTWSNGASTEDIQNLASGNYSVTVTDINNCALVSSFMVEEAFSFPAITAQTTPATCGNNDGAIDLTITPANGNIFLWSNGSSTEDLSNLAPGDYIVTVTGLYGCVSSVTIVVSNQTSSFSLTANLVANNSCLNPNGTIDLTVTPSATYTYLWSNTAVTEDLQNLTSGVFSVTVTDALNCASSDTFLILDNTIIPVLSANITPAICGTNNGAIDLMAIPAVNNSYLWSNGEVTEDLLFVFPGSYSVMLTDSNGCQALDTFFVPNNNNNFSIAATPVSNTACSIPNGAIDLSIAPAGTYTFLWSNGAFTEDIANLSAGAYTVTVTDATFCSSSDTFFVGNSTTVISISPIINPALCGAANGSIDLIITPVNGNSFTWSNGAVSEDVQNLIPGIYIVTVTESGGCTAIDTIEVPEAGNAFSLAALQSANTNCKAPNGTIDLSVIPPGSYSYLWSNGPVTQDQGNLAPGIYTVTVLDNNGCSSAESFTVSDQTIQPVLSENITPSTCGNANGQIDIAVDPPGIYVFTWSDGSTGEDLINVVAGTYMVTVTSEYECSDTISIAVPNINSNFSFTALISANTSCSQSNGSINISVAPSGTYSFLWSNGAVSEDLVNLPAGTYTVIVTDASGCSSAETYLVDESYADLKVEETITPMLCGQANGGIDLNVTPPSGNTFIWSNGSTTEDLQNILSGIYSVTITAQNGCLWSYSFNVPGTGNIELSLETDIIQTGDAFVTIRALVNLPLSALDTLIWLPEALFDCTQSLCLEQTIARPLQQTEIMVMVVDTNGCMAEARLTLRVDTDPEVYIPNVFSPNNDGINDYFTIYANKDVEQIMELRIYDRWGNHVFTKNEFFPNIENYGWDGRFRDKEMNPAVFVYGARVLMKDGSQRFYKGDITLVR